VLGLAQYLLIETFRLTEVTIAAPFIYAQLIWSALIGYLVWGDLPDIWVISGAAILVTSGLFLIRQTGYRQN
jgi:drug/metabolite transporter (DMT)-like permease